MSKTKKRVSLLTLALALLLGLSFASDMLSQRVIVSELIDYVDEYGPVEEIAEDDVPLATKPVVKTTKTTKTNKTTTRLSAPAPSTKKVTSRKTSTKKVTTTSNIKKVEVKTQVVTTVVKQTTRYSYIQKNTTTVDTTVTTTTTTLPVTKKMTTITKVAPKAHKNVIDAYNRMGFKTSVDSTVAYNGKFSASTKSIILQKESTEASYHELGHFVAFLSGNTDRTPEFVSIFNAEKKYFTASRGNTNYILNGGSIEYFADSYQDYVENPTKLKRERPKTFAYIKAQVAKCTNVRADLYLRLYAPYWNNL